MKTSKVLFGLALALGITASAFASTVDVSPVDKKSSKDDAGKIYASGSVTETTWLGEKTTSYFWTNLGYAQIKDSNGKPVDLYTPFIYHTKDDNWDASSKDYNPVHKGTDTEMQCKETMANIYVGEFDRIIKALYHNDLKVYNAINGGVDQETGQAVEGLRQKAITSIKENIVSKNLYRYDYKNDEDKLIGSSFDRNDVVTNFTTSFDSNTGKMKFDIEATNQKFTSTIEGVASKDYVDAKLDGLTFTDTNTTNKEVNMTFNNTTGKLYIGITDTNNNTIKSTIEGIASQEYVNTSISNALAELPEVTDTNTVTTISGDSWISTQKITDVNADTYHYNLSFNEGKLQEYIQQYSNNTVTTVTGTGLANVTVDGNHNYTVDVSADAVKEIAKSVDTNTKVQKFISDRDSANGKISYTIIDSEGNEFKAEVGDVASHKELKDYKESNNKEITNIKNTHNEYVNYNETDKNIMKQEISNNSHRIDGLSNKVSKLDSQVKETGAMSAALAGLHPRFTDGNKGEWLMSMGYYKGKTAYATGLAYAPDEKVMFTLGGSTVGGGDYMVNLGATFALDRVDKNKDIKYTRREVDQIVEEIKAENAELRNRLAKLEALLVK